MLILPAISAFSQSCPDNQIPGSGNLYLGIHTQGLINGIRKPIHINGDINNCPASALRLSISNGEYEKYFGHLAILSPAYYVTLDSAYTWLYPPVQDFNPFYNMMSEGDLILKSGPGWRNNTTDQGEEWKAQDLILASGIGNIVFATTENKLVAWPPGLGDRERMIIAPDGRICVNGRNPIGFFDININSDINFDGEDIDNLPDNNGHFKGKVSFSADENQNTSIRIYTPTGGACENEQESSYWWIEQTHLPSLAFRTGVPVCYGEPEEPETKVSFLYNGNVGIGVEAPSYKLQVDGYAYITSRLRIGSDTLTNSSGHFSDCLLSVGGKAVAQEVIVTIDYWSDFVFDKDYKLTNLLDLERQIKEKGHLPGMPTAKEVKENGVKLGEMQAKLLQKVEEMTLYMIELKKENEELKKEISIIKKETAK
ncbi:MAG: hypothetical protein QG635_437 [Bacteroidota bacterium]|nr:hypothetical protein [Bacteroidota bacterium]